MEDLNAKRALYPRVSEIIGKQTLAEFQGIPEDVLAHAASRGDKVHSYCTAWAKNLWTDDIEEECKPFFDAFVEWAEAEVEEVVHTGIRLYDDTLKFTGEFDMILKLKEDKKIYLVDIKTSYNSSKSWPLQLAAYGHLCKLNGLEFDKIMNLHLKRYKPEKFEIMEGKKVQVSPLQVRMSATEHENITQYWEIFSSSLKCYDYFHRKEDKS